MRMRGISAGEIVNVIAQAIAAGMTVSELVISQVGTHPTLTASPLVYQTVIPWKQSKQEVWR